MDHTPVVTQEQLSQWRRLCHRHAESGCSEFWTTAFIADTLEKAGGTVRLGRAAADPEGRMGVPDDATQAARLQAALDQGANPAQIQRMEGLTGLIMDVRPDLPTSIALRFDIDANDVGESTDADHLPHQQGFASVNAEVCHACGHDAHTAIGLGLALELLRRKDSLRHNVRFIFEPGEEGGRGALPMLKAGAMNGVRWFIAPHVGFRADRNGDLMCGASGFLATTKFDVVYKGVSSHSGAFPHVGKNSLLAAGCALMNLHAIPRHGDGSTRITVGTLNGGTGRNVIPSWAQMCCETRGETTELNEYMFEKARKIIEHAAGMYDQEYELRLMGGCESAECDPELVDLIYETASEVPYFQQGRVTRIVHMGGSDDACTFMRAVQRAGGHATYIMLGCGLAAGHHHPRFDIDEAVLAPSVDLLLRAVLKINAL